MTPQIIALLTVVCVLTYSFEIVFGLAGTILMVTIMSLVVPTQVLVIYSILPQILVAVIGLVRTPRPRLSCLAPTWCFRRAMFGCIPGSGGCWTGLREFPRACLVSVAPSP
jgi:hypothetical protein